MQERPPEPPTRPIQEVLGQPAEPGEVPPFEPLLDQPMAIEPAAEMPVPGPISQAERERAAARAAKACTEGRLTLGGYADLVEILQQTDDRADFDQVVQEVRAAGSSAVVPTARTTSSLVAVLSGHDQKGSTRLGPTTIAVAVMGSVDLDLREATVSGPVTTIRTFSFWGGVDIRLPPGVRVETTSVPILAGNDVKLKGPAPRPDAPVIRLEMISVMAGVDVKDYGGSVKDLIQQRAMLGTPGFSEARQRLHQARLEARVAARDARHEAHRAAREARRHRGF